MKIYISMFLACIMLLACMTAHTSEAYASTKTDESRAIAIVFDNSGSMYIDDNTKAWCRATYAMEVFASMLNSGDTLLIYPMHTIEVGGKQYTMDNPYKITDSSQASSIRDIYTPAAAGTPFASVNCAVQGLKQTQADKKYMIVLTDGAFDGMNKQKTAETLKSYAGEDMTVMYLGIGNSAAIPDNAQSDSFVIKQAENSSEVLSSLTAMCNQIFGRDTFPKNRISENTVEFDISMSKLIVFVQGENVSELNVVGANGPVGAKLSETSTKYGEKGSNRGKDVDLSLQGMMVTYTDCAAGAYTIAYTGTATSVEVYYEPDADLDFVFTDTAGNTVDPTALYEGDYKVSFGMKDAKTGKLISSDLLGAIHYQGSYFINGQEYPITHDGHSGEVPISLKMGDTFDANLTVTYLSGYTISKDSTDFGWPDIGIQVSARPAGELRLEISGGDEPYSLQDLEDGAPYVVKVYYQGTQLTGSELEAVELKWDPETSNAEIKKEFAGDHWKLRLHYKDPSAPQDTVCGACTVPIYAFYCAQGSNEAQTQCPLTYNIEDDFSPLQIGLYVPETYIVIGELEESKAFVVNLKLNGTPLTANDFANTNLQVDCSGVAYTVTANEQDSSYSIKLLPTDGIAQGDYQIKVTALYIDHIGRETAVNDEVTVTLSNIPLWVRWVAGILLLLIMFFIIWIYVLQYRAVYGRCKGNSVHYCRLRPDEEKCDPVSVHIAVY